MNNDSRIIVADPKIPEDMQKMIDLTIEKCSLPIEVAKLTLKAMCESIYISGVTAGVKIVDKKLKEHGI